MALIKCVECGRQVSTLAAACPNCGAPVHHSEKTHVSTKAVDTDGEEGHGKDRSGLVLKLFLVVVALGLGYVFGKKHVDKGLATIMTHVRQYTSKSSSTEKVEEEDKAEKFKVLPDATAEDAPVKPGKIRPIVNLDKGPDKENDVGKGDLLKNGKAEPAESETAKPVIEVSSTKETRPSKPVIPEGAAKEEIRVVVDDGPPKPPVPEPAPAAIDAPAAKEAPSARTARETKEAPAPLDLRQKRLNSVLAGTKKLSPAVVAELRMSDDAQKLTVVVNKNWTLLSCEQKEAAVRAIHEIWKKNQGKELEFQDGRGQVVVSENHASKFITGKVGFKIEGCE